MGALNIIRPQPPSPPPGWRMLLTQPRAQWCLGRSGFDEEATASWRGRCIFLWISRVCTFNLAHEFPQREKRKPPAAASWEPVCMTQGAKPVPDGLASWASPSSLATGRPRGKDPGCSLLCVSGGFLSVPMSPGRNWPPEEFCLNPIKFREFPHNWEIPPMFSLFS